VAHRAAGRARHRPAAIAHTAHSNVRQSFERTSLVSSSRSSSVNTISGATRTTRGANCTTSPGDHAVKLLNPDKFHQEKNTSLALAACSRRHTPNRTDWYSILQTPVRPFYQAMWSQNGVYPNIILLASTSTMLEQWYCTVLHWLHRSVPRVAEVRSIGTDMTHCFGTKRFTASALSEIRRSG
jgi:hypothetical protein